MELALVTFPPQEYRHAPPSLDVEGKPCQYYDVSRTLNSLKTTNLQLEIQNISLLVFKHLFPLLVATFSFKKTQNMPLLKATLFLLVPTLVSNYLIERVAFYQGVIESRILANRTWIKMLSSLYTPTLPEGYMPPAETKVLGSTFWHSPKLIVEDTVIKARLDELTTKEFTATYDKYKQLNTLADFQKEDFSEALLAQANVTNYLKSSLTEDVHVFARLLRKKMNKEIALNSPLEQLTLEDLKNFSGPQGLYPIKIEDNQAKILENAPLLLCVQQDKKFYFTFGQLESLIKEAHTKNLNLDEFTNYLLSVINKQIKV